MANPAPVLRLSGTVHADPIERVVPAQEAQEAERNPETNAVTRPAREARDGYTVHDVMLLTKGGGFLTVVFRDAAVSDSGGYLPGAGDVVEDVPVYAYTTWAGPYGRRYPVAGFSFAGAVYAEEAKSRTSGHRVAAGV